MKYIVLILFILCVVYVHYRGRVRYGFWRQLADHSTFTAPLNVFMYLFSRVPTTPYLPQAQFPELQALRDNWQVIRDEGRQLMAIRQIKASDTYKRT